MKFNTLEENEEMTTSMLSLKAEILANNIVHHIYEMFLL